MMETKIDSPANSGKTGGANIQDSGSTDILSIFEAAYANPDLMSILSENLTYCNNYGAALYAVATKDKKALLETFTFDRK